MASEKILIVDDDRVFNRILSKKSQDMGWIPHSVYSAAEALTFLKNQDPDLVVLDVHLPDDSGVQLVKKIKEARPYSPILMVSVSGETQDVVAAIQNGASDYIRKPVDHEELIAKIQKLLEMRRIKQTEQEIGEQLLDQPLVGKSPQTQKLIREISQVSNSDATVLLRGETGTGKGLVAQIIHLLSHRKSKDFIAINCAAIPATLLESELFGHVKGAFTGAIRDKPGKFELANQGTVFLDEIGELPPELQVKLLRILQGQEFERVGGIKTVRVDVRVIAATNRNLEQAIQSGQFREDLFYRLNVLPVYIPPLRERREDVPSLVDFFLKSYSLRANKRFEKIPPSILEKLVNYAWPGNVRELQNVLERAVVLGRQPSLQMSDFILPMSSFSPAQNWVSPPPNENGVGGASFSSLKELERQKLVQALENAGGNISTAAKDLGISRGTIYRRLKKYQIGLKQ